MYLQVRDGRLGTLAMFESNMEDSMRMHLAQMKSICQQVCDGRLGTMSMFEERTVYLHNVRSPYPIMSNM